MTTTDARTTEYDRFGPWIDEVISPDDVPPLFRAYPVRLTGARLVLKVPRNIDRRDATPDMDLYDHLLVLDDEALTVLSRRVHRRGGPADGNLGFDVRTVPLPDVVAVRDVVSLLDGALTVATRDGFELLIRYNGAAHENIGRLVGLLRESVAGGEVSPTGRALLAAGSAVADPGAALDLGRDDQSLISHVRETTRLTAGLRPWVGHGRRRATRRETGIRAVLHAVTHRISPMTLHAGVVAADGTVLEILGRHEDLVRGKAPVMSSSRLVVRLDALDGIVVDRHARYAHVMVVTLRLGAYRCDVLAPEGSAAHALWDAAAASR